MNAQQFAEYIQQNPLMYPSMMEGYYPGAPQPIPNWSQIPRIEIPNGGVDITQKVIYENTHSSMLAPMNPPKDTPKQTKEKPKEKPKEIAPERVSERVQKRKHASASASGSQEPPQEEGDILKKLELFEVQIKNLQRVAGVLWDRVSAEEEERKKQNQIQNNAIMAIRDALVKDHADFRKGMETLARHSMDTRKRLKTHNKILDDFQGLVQAYTDDKMEHYLNERCLMKFNEMADKILSETEMTPEEIGEIARSLGLDTEEDKGLPPSTSETEEPMLVWNLDDVMALFNGEDRDVQPISG